MEWQPIETAPKDGTHEWEMDAYRIKPEPERETVEIVGGKQRVGRFKFSQGALLNGDTHRITFDTIDGKPDPASIKMEEL